MHGTRRGALIGLAATGGVITSAGLVLAGTFAVLARCRWWRSPRSASRWPSASCSTRSSSASVLVTALNLDIGRRMWWPSAMAAAEPAEPGDRVARAEKTGEDVEDTFTS